MSTNNDIHENVYPKCPSSVILLQSPISEHRAPGVKSYVPVSEPPKRSNVPGGPWKEWWGTGWVKVSSPARGIFSTVSSCFCLLGQQRQKRKLEDCTDIFVGGGLTFDGHMSALECDSVIGNLETEVRSVLVFVLLSLRAAFLWGSWVRGVFLLRVARHTHVMLWVY